MMRRLGRSLHPLANLGRDDAPHALGQVHIGPSPLSAQGERSCRAKANMIARSMPPRVSIVMVAGRAMIYSPSAIWTTSRKVFDHLSENSFLK
jgi:hypothetical protein